MSNNLRMRFGKVPGRTHILSVKNCQDALLCRETSLEGESVRVGVLCDGCGEGGKSEVGANLAAEFILGEMLAQLKLGLPEEVIPKLIFIRTLTFLEELVLSFPFSLPGEKVEFIKNYLLFTVLGFLQTPRQTVVFAYGDGWVYVNGKMVYSRHDDAPTYLGYHLVDSSFLLQEPTALPGSFETFVFPTAEIERLAMGTDAWFSEADLLESVWGINNPSGLQRKMNTWSSKLHRFQDDASIILVEGGGSDAGSH